MGEVSVGPGKRTHAERYAREVGVPLSACAFYTDSYSDLPVLEVVGRPVAVHPDHRLRREALRRGWPVVDWGVPTAGVPATGSPTSP
jgi:phosphoserine phosphatase